MIKQNKWHKLILSDEAELSGISILKLMKYILEVEQFKFAILNNVELDGQGSLMRILNQRDVKRVKDLMFILPDVEQFEWGDIFLFKEYPKLWDGSGNLSTLINHTGTTIRALDYFYTVVYSTYDSVVEIIKKNYEIEEIKTDLLENLIIYPK